MKLRDVVSGANASMYYRLKFKQIKGVFYPRSESEVYEVLAKIREMGHEVTPKGGGSGLSGACTGGNRERVMLSSLRMNQVLTVAKDQGYADVQPGASPDEINKVLEPIGMKLWVAPSSRDIATVGGILSTDGGGNDTWENGTMRDNTIRVKLALYDGTELIVDWNGVKCKEKDLEAELNKKGMNLHDIASSHGTLGFITELRVKIMPFPERTVIGGVAEYDDLDIMGGVLLELIEKKCPIAYGEAIVQAHADVREELNPPTLILEFPENQECDIKQITDYTPLSIEDLAKMKDHRIKLPKRQPRDGLQLALFEGYGFHGESLKKMQNAVDQINDLLMGHGFTPFAKYGHAPSKWYLGDNTAAYGIIMHSREIRPPGKTGEEIFDTVKDIVDICQKFGITPKPEHKWPFSDEVKKARLLVLREIMGDKMNPFIFEPDCASDTLASMV